MLYYSFHRIWESDNCFGKMMYGEVYIHFSSLAPCVSQETFALL